MFPSQNKMPLVKWSTEATTDPKIIAVWWDHLYPDADVCIKTGAESGLVVIDWDCYKQDTPAFPLDNPPPTYCADTPKGGYHLYFKHPGWPVANSVGKLAPFIDVRGDGGMVVAYHGDGVPLADLPEGWGKRRTEYPTEQVSPVLPPYEGEGDGLELAVSLLEGYAERISKAEEGTLNNTLWTCAADAFKMVAAGELKEETVIKLMFAVAVAAGHPADGAMRTINSARSRGMLEPRGCVDMYWRANGR